MEAASRRLKSGRCSPPFPELDGRVMGDGRLGWFLTSTVVCSSGHEASLRLTRASFSESEVIPGQTNRVIPAPLSASSHAHRDPNRHLGCPPSPRKSGFCSPPLKLLLKITRYRGKISLVRSITTCCPLMVARVGLVFNAPRYWLRKAVRKWRHGSPSVPQPTYYLAKHGPSGPFMPAPGRPLLVSPDKGEWSGTMDEKASRFWSVSSCDKAAVQPPLLPVYQSRHLFRVLSFIGI